MAGLLLFWSSCLHIKSRDAVIPAGDITLSAQLVLPRWIEGPLPAAVVVHGSGATAKRDLRGWARKLVPHGMAVLLYDKRGVGETGGVYSTVSPSTSEAQLAELARDAAAALEWLKAQPEVDPQRVGYVGGSQAGWIMPLASDNTPDVAFIVAVSGPAVTLGQELLYSQLTGDDPGPYVDLSRAEIETRLRAFDGPHGYDPGPVLAALKAPTLWLLGGADPSVPTFLSIENLESIRASGNGAHEWIVYEHGEHNLRDVRTGKRIDYWRDLRDWLRQRGCLSSR